MLGLARRVKARFLLASTSGVYGDPKQIPQKETYHGYVNPVGIKVVMMKGKNFETLCSVIKGCITLT